MSVNAVATPPREPRRTAESSEPCELKGSIAPLTVLRVLDSSADAVLAYLGTHLAQAGEFLSDAPILIDLGRVPGDAPLALDRLISGLRALKLVPVAAQHVAPELEDAVRSAGLGLLRGQARAGRSRPPAASAEPAPRAATPAPAPAPAAKPERAERPRVVRAAAEGGVGALTRRTPVRGGQVVYARDRDLVVLAPVNPGAQVVADGNLHVYGILRGQALAGATGDESARIFCQHLQAELVSIAGTYLMHDQIPKSLLGKSVQIFLDGDRCAVEAL